MGVDKKHLVNFSQEGCVYVDHFVVMGYPVNIASRIQSLTKALNNNIIVSDVVYNAMENPPANRHATSTNLKGVEGVCQVYLIGQPYSKNRE